MDYLIRIFNLLEDNLIIDIQDRALYIKSQIKDTKIQDIINCFELSFILFESDIYIYEILLDTKMCLVYNIQTKIVNQILEIPFKYRTEYGIKLIGILKPIFPEYFRSRIPLLEKKFINFYYNLQLIERGNVSTLNYHKNLRKRNSLFNDICFCYIIGTLNNEFILIKALDSIIVIDQHGLHERILYERLKYTNDIDQVKKMKACRSAVKFGDFLDDNFIIYLINEMQRCEHPFICAHGRPIIYKLMP